jgi:hypothetical protein
VQYEEPKPKRTKSASAARQAQQQAPASVSSLSDEVTSLMLSFLSIEDHLVTLPRVCRRFRTLLKLTSTWPPTLSFSPPTLAFWSPTLPLRSCNITSEGLACLVGLPLKHLDLTQHLSMACLQMDKGSNLETPMLR